jgi:hypothetical protein
MLCVAEAEEGCRALKPAEEGRNVSKLAEGSRRQRLAQCFKFVTVDDQHRTKKKSRH